jgi:haloacetate dehalogenase
MFSRFQSAEVTTRGARIRIRHGGSGPPLLLLHGYPQTHFMWHAVADSLAEHFHVIAADLRGYGDSVALDEDARQADYSFRAMAQDQVEVMAQLGYNRFFVAGHDRGARTTHRMALDHPEKVLSAAVLDIVPTDYVWQHLTQTWTTSSWHWAFLALRNDLPYSLLSAADPRWLMERLLFRSGTGPSPFCDAAFEEYVRCCTPRTIAAWCGDYSAGANVDLTHDAADSGRRIECPLLVLWGKRGLIGSEIPDIAPVWRAYASNITAHALDCGHYLPEESPHETLQHLTSFFMSFKGV